MAQLFQQSLKIGYLLRAWKETTIIPVPKKPPAHEMENFTLVALTLILCKCMKREEAGELTTNIGEFAYKLKWGVEDANFTLLDTVIR